MVELPQHDEISRGRHIVEAAAIVSAAGLVLCHIVRLTGTPGNLSPGLLPAVVLGALCADFVSGLVHWVADTWFHESLPVLGRRLLHPFRVHHVNPDDFLRRGFLTVNGDVALLSLPILLSLFALPLGEPWGRLVAAFFTALAMVALPTNQVHQWAHMPRPPAWVGWLQRRRIILGRDDHLRHHRPPYAQYYCIATGWLNRPLARIDFFRRAERVVTALTGLQPRADDERFQARVEM